MRHINSATYRKILLTASLPLLSVVDYALLGVVLSLVMVIALLASVVLVNLCHRIVSAHLRFALLLLVAAGVSTALGMLLETVAWGLFRKLQPVLPFLCFNSFVFVCLEQDAYVRCLREALSVSLGHVPWLLLVFIGFGSLSELLLHGSLGAGFGVFSPVFEPAGGILFAGEFSGFPVFSGSAGTLLLLSLMLICWRLLLCIGRIGGISWRWERE